MIRIETSETMTAARILHWTVGDVQIHRIVEVADHVDPIGMLLKATAGWSAKGGEQCCFVTERPAG